ncbi:MAG: tRNA pseudouridine(38-40) synthase TruA [Trueperaceae bacterium]|nr:tRNA pseudouridine(38-40) synthase TruA [Trueperaceae bacterium]
MKRRLKLTLEYDGSAFFGWQIQTKTGERTVQGVLQGALAKLPGEHSSLKAAGRTDAGVHALAMAAHFDTTTSIPDNRLLRALNANLPPDVRVLKLEPVSDTFEAQYDCLYRQYLYRMRYYRDDLSGMSLDRFRVLPLFRELDAEAMQAATTWLLGKHDFAAFATQETRATVREIYLCKLEITGRDLSLQIAADGFLRNMVRAVVGTLIKVGEGVFQPEDIKGILESKDRAQAGDNVPPQGLYFVKAGYDPWKI